MKTFTKVSVLALGVALVTSCSSVGNPQELSHPVQPQTQNILPATLNTTDKTSEELIETYQGTMIPLETVEEATAPIEDTSDPELFEYSENVSLTNGEVTERLESLNSEYALGEPFTEKDLELIRAYTQVSTVSDDKELGHQDAVIHPALYSPDNSAVASPAGFNWFTGNGSKSFSKTKKSQKVTAKLSGKLTRKVSSIGFNNSWHLKAKGNITAGRSNVKDNAVKITFNAYGTVAKWPFVGRIYSKTVKVSNKKNNVSFDRTHTFDGFETNWTATVSQDVKTKSGSFNVVP